MLVSVKLDLPAAIVAEYESRGTLEKVLAAQLIKCTNHTSNKPLYIDDTQRQALDKLFGRNFTDATQLVEAVTKLASIAVEDVQIPLNPVLTTRLRSRCFGKPFEVFLREQTVRGLEEYAGMR